MATTTAALTATTREPENGGDFSKTINMRGLKQSIETNLSYLIKDLKHEHEKPYTVNYDTGGVIPRTNTKNESKPVVVQNFRDIQGSRSFEEYGFGSAKIDSALASAEFNDEARVEEVYYPAVKKVLWEMFPDATRIETLEHGLRKRHSQFPIATGEAYEFYQPATLVHTDYTLESAERTARAAFGLSPDQYRRIITLNFWKSFQGPGNDWPLALCDWRTIDRKSESITADVVFHNRFTENERIYYSPKHKWYWFKDLGDDEVLVFRQTDSDIEGGGGVSHASFFNSQADANAAPRESIELRAFVFYA